MQPLQTFLKAEFKKSRSPMNINARILKENRLRKAKAEKRIINERERRISVAEELEKFASLREREIITEDEFEQKKRALLG